MTLIHGDCLVEMKSIPDGSIDMILCDLPYGMTDLEWDVQIPFEPLWEQYERVIKEDGAIVLFSSQPFATDLINSNRKLFRYEIIWEKTMKTGFLLAKKMPMKGHENILVFYKKLPTYNPQMEISPTAVIGRVREKRDDRASHYGKIKSEPYVDTGTRYPGSVIKFSNQNGVTYGDNSSAVVHPTQKPTAILEWLINTYTNEGDTVLDNTMGSGSTGVACVNTGRNFIGIDLDKDFYDIAVDRIQKAINGWTPPPKDVHPEQMDIKDLLEGAD